MIEYIIGAILLIITILIILLILRTRIYNQVDAFESWKIDVMNRNVASELSKIKELNLSGETQEKFERWKSRWEKIVAGDLADVEEYLYDAEEAADRFIFPKANKILKLINEILTTAEQEVDKILEELDILLQVEKDSKERLTETSDEVERLKTILSEQRYQFGKADRYYEIMLDEIENQLLLYDEYVESGEYTKAKQHVKEINEKVLQLSEQITQFPAIYQKCRKELPGELYQLTIGIGEMNTDGFRVEPYKYDEEITKHEETLQKCVQALEKGEVNKVTEIATEIESRISEIYQSLEREAIAKNFVESQMDQFMNDIEILFNSFNDTKEEVENLKVTYFFADEYMERLLSLEKRVNKLVSNSSKLAEDLKDEQYTHLQLRERLESNGKLASELSDEMNSFVKNMNNLRKDELNAKDKLEDMRIKLNEINRSLQTGNLPGVPNFLWDRIEESKNKLTKVVESLERQPLDISEVQHALDEANKAVEQCEDETEIIIDQCYLTEQVIQYANKYRSQYPLLSAELSEAERLFREFEYELALEKAARAIEEIEPGALRRIEENHRYRQLI